MLYGAPTRQAAWEQAEQVWDLIVVGGGITGAGILREAVLLGLNVLLLEQNDFASGTSSRSSKLVHGGLRYLNNFQIGLTWQSVSEREILLKEGEGLINPLPFLMPTFEGDKLPSWMYEIGLYMYGWMGRKWRVHRVFDAYELQMLSPALANRNLKGGFRFYDAQTDDARLVLRVLKEGIEAHREHSSAGRGIALNYAQVEDLRRDSTGHVSGVWVVDRVSGEHHELQGKVIINATGAWADRLRVKIGAQPRIRPLRGSHLIFRSSRFPLYQAVSFPHPEDGRPVFAFPWEGVTLVGTTDLDHQDSLDEEPRISDEEIDYLLNALRFHFPSLDLARSDIMTTFAGVRPVIGSGGDVPPSKESREHALWEEDGLLTVTGGKLTTFRLIALDALKTVRRHLPNMGKISDDLSALDPLPAVVRHPPDLTSGQALRLAARYGAEILEFAGALPAEERMSIGTLPIHWMEFQWAARHEAIVHLDDLLLRRVRLGLLAPDGGEKYLPRIRALVQSELGWDDAQWEQEEASYLALWQSYYGSPADIEAARAIPFK